MQKNRRILVIDDNRAIHDDFRKILAAPTNMAATFGATEAAVFGQASAVIEKTEFEISSAYQGRDGVLLAEKALAAGLPYAMAFVDVRMPPGWDGVETARKLWELDPDLQVVLCTAYSDYSWDEMFEQLGQRDGLLILKKPFDAVEALQLAHALTEKWWLHQKSRLKTEELAGMVAARTEELVKSVSLLNATFESMADGIVAVDLSGKVVSYNSKFASLWHFPTALLDSRDASEMRAHTAGQIKNPAKFLQRLEELKADPEAEGFDVIELKDGRIFERYIFPQRVDQKCVGVVISWRDVTERKQAEEALRESQQIIEGILNAIPIRVFWKDQNLVYLGCNAVFAHDAGFDDPKDIIGKDDYEMGWRDQAELYRAGDREVIQSGNALVHVEEPQSTPDGSPLTLLTSKTLLRNSKGEITGVLGTYLDITERKRSEEVLRESEERFSSAFEHAPIGVALVSPDGRWLKVNRALCDLVGYSEAELLGQVFQDITYPEDLEADLENVRRIIANEIQSYQMEKRYIHARGHLVTVLLNVSLVRNNGGTPRYFISQIQDITERKQAETLLVESQQRLALAKESAHFGIWDWNVAANRMVWDTQMYELYGIREQDFSGAYDAWQKGLHPEDRERSEAKITAALEGREDFDIEFRVVWPSGEVRDIEAHALVQRADDGSAVRMIGVNWDITERKQAEAVILESKRFLRSTLDALSSHIAILDERGVIIEVNAAWNRFAADNGFAGGRSGVGDNYLNVCGSACGNFADEASAVVIGIRAIMAGQNEEFHLEYPCHSPQEKRWFIVRATRFGGDGPVRVVVAHENITQRKLAESRMHQSQERYRSLIDNASDAIFTIAADGTFTSLNPAVETIAGLTREEWIGKPFAPMVHPDDLPLATQMFQHILKGEQASVHELRGNPSLKRPALMEMTLTAQKDESGSIIGVLGIGRDITERKRLEGQIFESQKMETVGKLAGGIAHEFNSILTAIIGQSELLREDLPAGSPLVKNATEISQAAGRAATLTRQLLAYGRKQFLQQEVLNLNRITASMEGIFHHLMGGEVDVQIIPGSDLIAVKADAGQIEQVIMNMVINARDAMPNGGKLTLETANISFDEESVGRDPELKAGDYVMLAITDTGIGMSEEIKRRIFEPFFSTKGTGLGTGLGLSTSYGIVKQSGGHISVYTEPGRGSTFKIYLPQVEQPPQALIPRLDSPGLPRGTETILLVEDDPAMREMATMLLKRLGYTVLAAANGIEALSLKQQRDTGHVDLLFTDIVMPHMSGNELAGRVRALFPHTKILFTSAYAENAIVHQGVLKEGAALLQKPFTPSALAHKLREVLDCPAVN